MTAPPALSERDFQQRILDYCRLRGLLVFHDHDSRRNNPGFPDLVIVGTERVLFRELKTDKGAVRPEQDVWLSRLRAAGQDARIWRPSQWNGSVLPELRALTARDHLVVEPTARRAGDRAYRHQHAHDPLKAIEAAENEGGGA